MLIPESIVHSCQVHMSTLGASDSFLCVKIFSSNFFGFPLKNYRKLLVNFYLFYHRVSFFLDKNVLSLAAHTIRFHFLLILFIFFSWKSWNELKI